MTDTHEYNGAEAADPIWPYADENAPPTHSRPPRTPVLKPYDDIPDAEHIPRSVVPEPASTVLRAHKHPRLRKLRDRISRAFKRVFRPKSKAMRSEQVPSTYQEPRTSRFTEGFDVPSRPKPLPMMDLPTTTFEENQHKVQLRERFETPLGTPLDAIDEVGELERWDGGSGSDVVHGTYQIRGMEGADGVELGRQRR